MCKCTCTCIPEVQWCNVHIYTLYDATWWGRCLGSEPEHKMSCVLVQSEWCLSCPIVTSSAHACCYFSASSHWTLSSSPLTNMSGGWHDSQYNVCVRIMLWVCTDVWTLTSLLCPPYCIDVHIHWKTLSWWGQTSQGSLYSAVSSLLAIINREYA